MAKKSQIQKFRETATVQRVAAFDRARPFWLSRARAMYRKIAVHGINVSERMKLKHGHFRPSLSNQGTSQLLCSVTLGLTVPLPLIGRADEVIE